MENSHFKKISISEWLCILSNIRKLLDSSIDPELDEYIVNSMLPNHGDSGLHALLIAEQMQEDLIGRSFRHLAVPLHRVKKLS
jgi:hypothetical protein